MHKKFVDRLATIYVTKLIASGNAEAKAWAERFLSRDNVLDVAKQVTILLKQRGFKIKE